MSTMTNPEEARDEAPQWATNVLPVISAVVGSIALWATWSYYNDRLQMPGTDWLAWIQPALLVLGGTLSLVAAALLAARRPSGRAVLHLAVGIIPVILATRLVIVVLRFIGHAWRWIGENASQPNAGVLLERLWSRPLSLAINLTLLVVVALVVVLSKAEKPGDAPRANDDER